MKNNKVDPETVIRIKQLLSEEKTWQQVGDALGITPAEAIMILAEERNRTHSRRNGHDLETIERVVHCIVIQKLSHKDTAKKLRLSDNVISGIILRTVNNHLVGKARPASTIFSGSTPSSEILSNNTEESEVSKSNKSFPEGTSIERIIEGSDPLNAGNKIALSVLYNRPPELFIEKVSAEKPICISPSKR